MIAVSTPSIRCNDSHARSAPCPWRPRAGRSARPVPTDMPQPTPTPPAPPRRVSKARRRLGSIVALLVLAAIVALAWYLTHRPAPTNGPGGGPPAAARGAGGRGPGAAARGSPPSTVGVATAKHADIPVYIDALGTVTPIAVANRSEERRVG